MKSNQINWIKVNTSDMPKQKVLAASFTNEKEEYAIGELVFDGMFNVVDCRHDDDSTVLTYVTHYAFLSDLRPITP